MGQGLGVLLHRGGHRVGDVGGLGLLAGGREADGLGVGGLWVEMSGDGCVQRLLLCRYCGREHRHYH